MVRFLLLIVLLTPIFLFGQRADSIATTQLEKPHHINYWVSTPLTIGLGVLAARRADLIRSKDPIPRERLNALNPEDVNGFDRWATKLDIDNRSRALFFSDYMQNFGQSSPLLLMFWKKYRRNVLDIGLMYLEAQTLQGLIYGYSPWGPASTDRLRPFAYYRDVEIERRTDGNERNSTYSGHVSTTTTGFFFVAKIIDDYNPDLTGGQRTLLYTGALVPSLISGYFRIRALKHFPSDTALGLVMGAISGWVVPEIHHKWAKRHRSRLAATPIYGNGAAGAALSLHF